MPIRSWSVRRSLPLIPFSVLAVVGACATGGALTDAELQELTQGVQSTATGASATTTGTTGAVTSGPVAPGPGSTTPMTGSAGSTSGMVAPGAPPGTVVVPEMMNTGSTEIAEAPEEEEDPPGGSNSPGGSAGGESSVEAGGSDSGGSSGFGTPPGGGGTAPGGGSCSNFSDSECDSLEMFAVAWCKALISCVNVNCDPTADDPLCFVPNYPEDPCVTTGYANGGLGKYADGGGNTNIAVDRAEEIIDAACGF
jgi:hypothetical protein